MRYHGFMNPDERLRQVESRMAPSSWGIGDVLCGLCLVLGCLPIIIGAGALLVGAAHLDRSLVATLASALLEVVIVGAAWWFSIRKYRLRWADLGLRCTLKARGLALAVGGIAAGLVCTAIYGVVLEAIGLRDTLPVPPLLQDGASTLVLALGLTLAIVVAPLAEELFFRGFVFGGLQTRIGVRWGAFISASLFTVAHMNPMLFVPIFVMGLILTWVYMKSGSLLYPILAHLGYNGLVVLLALTT